MKKNLYLHNSGHRNVKLVVNCYLNMESHVHMTKKLKLFFVVNEKLFIHDDFIILSQRIQCKKKKSFAYLLFWMSPSH